MESLRRVRTNFSRQLISDAFLSIRSYSLREQGIADMSRQFHDGLVSLRRYLSREQHLPPSHHGNLSFIASSLLNLLQLMPNSPFQTHPKTIGVAIISLLIYGLAYDAEQRFSFSSTHPSPIYANVARRGMMVFGSLLLASLASIFFPHTIQPFLYLLYIFVYADELQNWLHRRLVMGELGRTENNILPV